jgi:hypothetical protein
VLWGGGWGGGSTLPEEAPPPVPRHRTQHSKYNQSTSDANHIRQGAPFSTVLPTLCSTFSASPEEKFGVEEKIGPLVVCISCLKEFGLKNTIFVSLSGTNNNISWTSLELERIRLGGKQYF